MTRSGPAESGAGPMVDTVYGRIRGRVEEGVAVFRGVPYAAAPTGPRRYRPPQPPTAWSGVRDAGEFGVTAPQLASDGLFASTLPWGEDCLTVNVWTPAPDGAARPVLVWIHGGAFLFGTGANPIIATGSFARDDVVFVSVNYRLGSDGFLYTPGDPGSGNYGLLDQIAALHWVADNIAAFGGDPGQVTIGGQSAGATAVAALLAAPAARGLFARAILQSGYPDPLLSPESATVAAAALYARLGLSEFDVDGLRTLRESEPHRVLAAQMDLFAEVLSHRDGDRFPRDIAVTANPFQPVVGGPVLPRRPIEALAGGGRAPFDLLIGHTTEEFALMYGVGMIPHDASTMDAVEAAFERVFPGRGRHALDTYRATRPGASLVDLLVALESDRLYAIPTRTLADTHAGSGARTYFYRFGWRSPDFGAGHCIEQPFVFDALSLPLSRRFTGQAPPQRLAGDMHRAWVSFAATGNPGHRGLPVWPRYAPPSRMMLQFGDTAQVVADPAAGERALWEHTGDVTGTALT